MVSGNHKFMMHLPWKYETFCMFTLWPLEKKQRQWFCNPDRCVVEVHRVQKKWIPIDPQRKTLSEEMNLGMIQNLAPHWTHGMVLWTPTLALKTFEVVHWIKCALSSFVDFCGKSWHGDDTVPFFAVAHTEDPTLGQCRIFFRSRARQNQPLPSTSDVFSFCV